MLSYQQMSLLFKAKTENVWMEISEYFIVAKLNGILVLSPLIFS